MYIRFTLLLLLLAGQTIFSLAQSNHPIITSKPIVYHPSLLKWPRDFTPKTPDLSEPTSNRIYDLHAQVNDCSAFDLIVSTGGNYHMALTDFWYNDFLKKNTVQNWYFSTSPPISPEQATNKALSFGNVALMCAPHVAIGPQDLMDELAEYNLILGTPQPLFTNRGNVLLVKKGNPKNIKGIEDLAREEVRLATPNPSTEKRSFSNYARSIYQIVLEAKGEAAAKAFFDKVFNTPTSKWIVGERIHHREVPHLLFADQADVALLFYHLARYVQQTFPDEFDIVPLGGTVAQPDPLPGNVIGKFYVAKLDVPLTPQQEQIRTAFLTAFLSGTFEDYLKKHFIDPTD
ncbi:MAG: substrate-binding domain-containing protein [Bacteroidota bacterium]